MKSILFIVAAVYCLSLLLLFVFQRHLLYLPSPAYEHSLLELEIKNQGETLKVIVLNPGQQDALIYFGGNAEPVIFNELPFQQTFPEHTVYLVNYRAYGGSTGKPSEKALYADALAIFDELSPQHKTVSLIGRSLGSGVATYLASHRAITAMALITPYDSIANVAQAKFPIFPVGLLLLDQYDSISRAAALSVPTLIVIAEQDTIIPPAHSFALRDAFPKENVHSLVIQNADHNNLSARAEYYSSLTQFFRGERNVELSE